MVNNGISRVITVRQSENDMNSRLDIKKYRNKKRT